MGIDNGGTMTKAAIFDLNGNEIATGSVKTPLIISKEGFQELDMLVLWDATICAIKKALEKSNIDSAQIAGIGCTGHGKGLYPWGKDDKPAYNAIASTDHRATDYITKWRDNGILDKAKELTMQKAIACQPVAILAWLKDHNPVVYNNIRWIFEAKDYIRFMLTGEAFAEITDYSGSSLMNLHTKQFDISILKLFGIEETFDNLPPLKYSYDLCGTISKAVSELTGLKEGTPVSGGMFDIDACAIAMDVSTEDKLCIITGTWSINEYISKAPVSPDFSTLNSLFCIQDYYLIEESSPTSAGNLDWYINKFMQKDEELAKEQGISIYSQIDNAVAALPPDQSNIIFLPFLYGTNSEKYNSAVFVGLNNSHEHQHLLRAVFEGVVFSHMVHIERLLKLRKPPKTIRLAGGASNSSTWVQIFADVIGIPIEVVTTKELGALGCAMSAAVCTGCFPDYSSSARKMVKFSNTIYPNPAYYKIYRKKYAQYLKLIEALGTI